MSEEEGGNDLLGLTEKIVSAHVANNAMSSADLPDLIRAVYAALGNVKTAGEAPPTPKPAVPIKRSVTPNHIVCLEDGKKFKMLKRHLKTDHNMTPKEYRERWGLPSDYPIVAPARNSVVCWRRKLVWAGSAKTRKAKARVLRRSD